MLRSLVRKGAAEPDEEGGSRNPGSVLSDAANATPDRPILVVVAEDLGAEELHSLAKVHPDEELHLIASPACLELIGPDTMGVNPWAATDLAQVNWCLRMIGSPRTILDKMEGPAALHREYLARLLLHLAPGGRYVIDRQTLGNQLEYDGITAHVALLKAAAAGGPSAGLNRMETELLPFVGGVELGAEHILVEKTGRLVLRIPEASATRTLGSRLRHGTVRELKRIPPRDFVAKGRTTSHASTTPVENISRNYRIPSLVARDYEGDIEVVRRCLVLQESAVLPESFRFQFEKHPANPMLRDAGPDFAVVREAWNGRREKLPGVYYHLDCSNSGHFGHIITEVIPRLWAWSLAKKEYPELKVIFRTRHHGEGAPNLEIRILRAYGIPLKNIVWSPVPVRVEHLLAAAPQWQNQAPHYADPGIVETWQKIASGLERSKADFGEKIFASRRPSVANRVCRNTDTVERFFVDRGFSVVYPEEYDIADQASIFSRARIVAGFGGSALFNLMYARAVERIIVLAHEAYTARNENLFGAVRGADVDYFWSTPDIQHPEGGWSEAAYYSDWEFDFDRNGAELDAALR